jgi:hypothetical protein
MKKVIISFVSLSITLLTAYAAWTVDIDGYGFVGKGDVQLLYGWSNTQLQKNADKLQFRSEVSSSIDQEWICLKVMNNGTEQVTERNNTEVTTVKGLTSNVTRVKNQITGFNLTGLAQVVVENVREQGPATFTCTGGGTYVDDTLITAPAVVTTKLKVSFNGGDFLQLPDVPAL